MSPNQLASSSTGPLGQTSVESVDQGAGEHKEIGEPDSHDSVQASTDRSQLLLPDQVRDIIRLIQCQQCSRPLHHPVTLPCGGSLCRQCLPETYLRPNISYPATANRLQGFGCPFPDCGKEHVQGDCGVDVILNKAIQHVRQEIEKGRQLSMSSELSTSIATRDKWEVAGISSLSVEEGDKNAQRVIKGCKLVATYTLAESGELEYDAEVAYDEDRKTRDDAIAADTALFSRVKSTARTEMDCQVCYAVFFDPQTTICGHTFCRVCLNRVLDHSPYCPVCRRSLEVNHRQPSPSNDRLKRIISAFWPDAIVAREEALAAEARNRYREYDIPLFVCTLAFPSMPTFLHVFEPRYRLMIRRALEGDRTFGMVLPAMPGTFHSGRHFMELGTLLRIQNVEYFADGRSLIETVGVSRFRVLQHNHLDGYVVAQIERIDDISLEEEEALEARETQAIGVGENASPVIAPLNEDQQAPGPSTPPPQTTEDLEQMPTRELMDFAAAFVRRMREQSVAWLARRMLAIYGDCPADPAVFPWWFANILPIREEEKYHLLEARSVRARLKICCGWILEWESNRW